jgi:dTDP-4-dehydrorhamnose reductase
MKYLVTGYNGQLGYDIVRELKNRGVADSDIFPTDVADMDITDRDAVMEKVTSIKPDVIFHNAAWTNVDGAEDMKEACEKVNYLGAKNMADAAKTVGAKIVYISTDYVFDGTKPLDETYKPTDKANPQNIYGKSKYLGEQIARLYDKTFVVRTSWVFGINGKNFIKTMRALSEKYPELTVVNDQFGSPTYTVDLAKLLVDMSLTDKYGTYHANNGGYCDWATFASYILNDTNTIVKPVSTEDYYAPQYAKAEKEGRELHIAYRPRNSKLSKECLTDAGFELLPSWEDATDRYIRELEGQRLILK